MWFWLSGLPSAVKVRIVYSASTCLYASSLSSPYSTDGKLELITSSNDPPAVSTTSSIRKITLDAYCISMLRSPWSKSEICESLSFLAANHMILCQAKRCALTWALPLPEAGFFKLGNTVLVILQAKRRRWTAGSYLLTSPLLTSPLCTYAQVCLPLAAADASDS